jgi:hypothetical protein
MPLYKLQRHVIYKPGCQETQEVWGVQRKPKALETCPAPRDTDRDDPLRKDCGDCCTLLLKHEGQYVTWDRFIDWLSDAEEAGYELISGYKNMTPYTVFILRGP